MYHALIEQARNAMADLPSGTVRLLFDREPDGEQTTGNEALVRSARHLDAGTQLGGLRLGGGAHRG
jgi:hypothetical protein